MTSPRRLARAGRRRPPAGSQRRRAALGGLVVAALAAGGGLAVGPAAETNAETSPGTSRASSVAALYDNLAFDGAWLLVPDRRFTVEDGAWTFVLDATFAWYQASAPRGRVEVLLEPTVDTRPSAFSAAWDGRPLEPAWDPAAGVWSIAIEEGLRGPGLHRLEVARRLDGLETVDPVLPSRFGRIAVRAGGSEQELAPAGLERSFEVSDFLLRGVVGPRLERRGGTLAVGPGRFRPTALGPPGARLRIEPENLSERPATFTLRGAGEPATVELPPRGRSLLGVALDADGGAILEVEGAVDGLFLWSLPVVETPRPAALPPIVLVTLDTTRRDVVGAYGGPPGLTPALDRFAAQATVYENARSPAPWTLPAHASLFTGLYPSRHGAGVDRDQLWPGQPTLAGLLRAAGYAPAGFSSGQLSASAFGLGLGFSTYRDPEGFETPGDRTGAAVDAWLAAGQTPRPPLFLFVNLFDPHALYRAPADLEARLGVPALKAALAGSPGSPVWERLTAGDDEAWRIVVEGGAPANPAALAYLRAAYQAEVAHADRVLGRLFATLEARGLFDPALVVVTSDHGELLGERGFFSHSARLDPELVEVPLLVKWPGQRRGRRVETPASLVDLFPTLLAAAGVAPPPSDGVALDPTGAVPAEPRTLYFEEHEHRTHPLFGPMRIAAHLYGLERGATRGAFWADGGAGGGDCARRRRGGSWEPAACPPERATTLAGILAAVGRRGDQAPVVDPRTLPAELRRALEALGYVGGR